MKRFFIATFVLCAMASLAVLADNQEGNDFIGTWINVNSDGALVQSIEVGPDSHNITIKFAPQRAITGYDAPQWYADVFFFSSEVGGEESSYAVWSRLDSLRSLFTENGFGVMKFVDEAHDILVMDLFIEFKDGPNYWTAERFERQLEPDEE